MKAVIASTTANSGGLPPASINDVDGGLLDHLHGLLSSICTAFFQDRTGLRGLRLALGHVVTLGTRTIARIIASAGRDQLDWTADYQLFSRAKWSPRELMLPVLDEALRVEFKPVAPAVTPSSKLAPTPDTRPVWVAGDHTHVTRCGRHVAGIQTIRDPMSPAYHVNLIKGLRFFHLSLLCSSWRHEGHAEVPARALPVRFEPSETLRRPGKKASDEDWKNYRKAIKEKRSSVLALDQIRELRADLDACGQAHRRLFMAMDGAFSNKTFYGKRLERLERIELISRLRRDAKLCFAEPAPADGKKARRFFAQQKFTPEEVLKDESIPWQTIKVRTGGREHTVRCKDISNVYWQRGAVRNAVRLIVIAPTGYRLSKKSKLLYRSPAFLVTTAMDTALEELVQGYVDRWQIEVAHRELKDSFGLEDSQVRHAKSVPRHAAFAVAVYSAVHLAALKAFGPTRTADYLPLAKWNKGGPRPSLLEIVSLTRHLVLTEQPAWVAQLQLFGEPTKPEEQAPEAEQAQEISQGQGYQAQLLVTKAAA
jgi:hypothetical protein